MRANKTTKTKINAKSPSVASNKSKSFNKPKTPIELALKIDENGMTTASNLYAFLELHPSHFSDWCKRNIKNNKFAIESKDYFPFIVVGERYNPNPRTDYKITSDFAKKLSMTGRTENHEQAMQYFIACEQGLKVATQKLNNTTDISPITEAITSISQAITSLTTNMTAMQQDIQSLKQSQRNRYLIEKRYPSAWYRKIAPKYKILMEYFDCSRNDLYSSIYKELEDTYNVDINQIHEDYCYENHLLKDECYAMDAIEHNNKLRDGLTQLIDASLIKYGLKTEEEIRHFKRETLFDREPVKKKNKKEK
jgi:Phage anti-repressor protein